MGLHRCQCRRVGDVGARDGCGGGGRPQTHTPPTPPVQETVASSKAGRHHPAEANGRELCADDPEFAFWPVVDDTQLRGEPCRAGAPFG